MKATIQIFIIFLISFSCGNSNRATNDLDKIKLGMTVENVIKALKIETSDLYLIQEPPLIYRGINAKINDSIEIGITFERTPANPDDISNEKGLEIVNDLKINGFAWKIKNGESKVIGEIPKLWNE